MLEFYEGAAPHITDEAMVRKIAGVPAERTTKAIERTCYIGPMTYYHEPAGTRQPASSTPNVLVYPKNREMLEIPAGRLKAGAGRLRAPSRSKTAALLPSDVWVSIERTGQPPHAVAGSPSRKGFDGTVDAEAENYQPTANAKFVEGIPTYKMSAFGNNS